jgi:hypothetical protein
MYSLRATTDIQTNKMHTHRSLQRKPKSSHNFIINIIMQAIFALFLVAMLQAVLGATISDEGWVLSDSCEGSPNSAQTETITGGCKQQLFATGSYTVACPAGKTSYDSEDCTGEGTNVKADGVCVKSCNTAGDVCASSKLSGCGATASGSGIQTGVVQGMGLVGATALLLNQ